MSVCIVIISMFYERKEPNWRKTLFVPQVECLVIRSVWNVSTWPDRNGLFKAPFTQEEKAGKRLIRLTPYSVIQHFTMCPLKEKKRKKTIDQKPFIVFVLCFPPRNIIRRLMVCVQSVMLPLTQIAFFSVLGEKLSRKYKLSSCKCIICVERIQRVTGRTRI